MKKKAANGDGTLFLEKKTGLFRAAISTPTKRIMKRFKTYSEASEWLVVTKAEIYSNLYIEPSNITVGEWIAEYLKAYCKPRLRPRTLERYKQTAKHLAPLADIPLQKLTAPIVQKFYNNLQLSGSGKLKVHTLLGAMLKKAAALDMIKKNIMLAVERPKYTPGEIQIFTTAELKQILLYVKNDPHDSKYYPLIYFAATTGARLGEILALKFKNIHPGYVDINESTCRLHGKLITQQPKTRASIRKITITKQLEHMLRHSKKVLSFDGYVFTTSTGKPFESSNIQKIWHRILLRAGVEYRNFHVLRHTHATQLLANGVPILEVAKRLGHSKASHTLTLYGHAIPGYDTCIPQKINQLLSME